MGRDECGHERLIPFSCKGRGICPSCNTRRMAELAGAVLQVLLRAIRTTLRRTSPGATLDARVLRLFRARGFLDDEDATGMLTWQGSGGFSIDASVRIEADDRAAIAIGRPTLADSPQDEPSRPTSPARIRWGVLLARGHRRESLVAQSYPCSAPRAAAP